MSARSTGMSQGGGLFWWEVGFLLLSSTGGAKVAGSLPVG